MEIEFEHHNAVADTKALASIVHSLNITEENFCPYSMSNASAMDNIH